MIGDNNLIVAEECIVTAKAVNFGNRHRADTPVSLALADTQISLLHLSDIGEAGILESAMELIVIVRPHLV